MSGYNKKDHYHRKAKEEGFLARSAYKLQEIQEKFKLLRNGSKVLDLGCAPGAWTQVALPLVGAQGLVVGVDLEQVTLTHERFRFMKRDAFTLEPSDLPESPFDVVLSDMAPKTSGVKIRDHALSVELCMKALEVARKLLKPGGSIVVKLFEGEDIKMLEAELKKSFATVKMFRPQSTRQASFEVYLIGTGKRA
jgi:23S rRNA (uridine2552-2'-O)-methyltransferase